MSGVLRWSAVALIAAAPAAAMAYIGGPIASAGLAAWAVAVVVGLAVHHDRRLSSVRAMTSRAAKDVTGVRAQNDKLRASVQELKAENAALRKQVDKTRVVLDEKIALAVQRMHEKFTTELSGLVASIRDSDVETGLAALNRYTALATHPAVLLGDEDPSPGIVAE